MVPLSKSGLRVSGAWVRIPPSPPVDEFKQRINNKMEKSELTDLLSEDPKIKYSGAKNLLAATRENPADIYPNLGFFVKLLGNENKILKWTAIDVIGALAIADRAKSIDELRGKLFGFLNTGNMITAHHAISALTDIALAKPEHQAEITDELLKVEHYNYDTTECRNISIGKVILAISKYFDKLEDKEAMIEFVRRQTKNSRNATRKKAEKFLTKFNLHK
jgi:hypothetical protein